jgi:hypothetical protein
MRRGSVFVPTGNRPLRNGPRTGRGRAFGVGLSLALACGPLAAAPSAGTEPPPRLRLVLQITVDGLRGDLLGRYREGLSPDGFRSLLERGTVFTNAHHEHANT